MLTKRQSQVYDFIVKFTETHDYAPSLEEIAKHFKLSAVSTIHHHVSQLVQKGYLSRRWNANRSLEVVDHESSSLNLVVPLLGVIAAGHPIEAIEQEETIELPPSLVGRKDTYVLRVRGDSMIEEHIRDGDYVVVERRDTADAGETVVALLNGSEATLKKFYREKKGGVRLQPANPTMAPIFCKEEECQIQGVVIAILRKFR
ncbi:MAG: transcriptional repressor LexA [Deltaproteobacteria bacterium]|nr:transcriptional repressor LexA [Deltaproteobacteria bacterium]